MIISLIKPETLLKIMLVMISSLMMKKPNQNSDFLAITSKASNRMETCQSGRNWVKELHMTELI